MLADISEAAKSMFAQMKRDGVAAQSFDLQLDLQQLGIKVGANGSRSVEGHSLKIDLRVEAVQGSFTTEDGEVSFGKLEVSFTMEETYFRSTESADVAETAEKPRPQGGLIDGLKKLVSLLDRTGGQPDDEDALGQLLMQIGRALEAMARRAGQIDEAEPGEEGFARRETIELHALQFEASASAVQIAQTGAA